MTNNFDDEELLALLTDIKQSIREAQCTNILWGGDINMDIMRATKFVQIVQDFIQEMNLLVFWSHPDMSPNQSMLHGRYIGFIDNISATKKTHLQMLFNLCKQNQACNTGQNIEYLLTLCKVESFNSLIMKKQVIKNGRIYPLKEDEEWLVEMIEEMCLSKLGFIATDIEEKDINAMLDIVCTE